MLMLPIYYQYYDCTIFKSNCWQSYLQTLFLNTSYRRLKHEFYIPAFLILRGFKCEAQNCAYLYFFPQIAVSESEPYQGNWSFGNDHLLAG